MSQVFLNNYTTRLTNAVLAADATITVDDAPPSLAVDDFYVLTIADKAGIQEPEIVKVTATSGNTLTVERAQEGTTAQNWSVSTPVEMRWTAGAVSEINRVIESIESVYVEWSSSSLYINQTMTGTITNYDSLTDYTVSAASGTASISGDTITYTAPGTDGVDVLTVNGRAIEINVLPAGIAAPVITSPTNGALNQNGSVTFALSAFSVTPAGFDTHVSTTVEVATDALFANIVLTETKTTGDLTSVTVDGHTESTQYYARARYNGNTLTSGLSSGVGYQTKDTFGGLIGTAGGQGFGAGVYPDESDTAFIALGLTGLTGYDDPASDNYGNYQHTNGSIMVFVPKFYFRVGNTGAAHYATYGANTLEIAGIDQFGDTTSATALGYTLHPAFVDGGAEKSGVFVDKYLLSKDGGNAVSVKNGNPISLTGNSSYTNSDGFLGGTGILADSVLLCRARGTGYNQTSAFIYSALAMLSDAHGQAATSATYCAWYDATGTTNCPKGCNSSLADVDDATVTFTVSPDNASKPLTGSASNLAKTAHNGQACGVVDLNGAMWEPALGITAPGTSGTSTTGISNDTIYVLKESVALADLTAGWNTGTDAWGNSTHLSTLYDAVTSSHALGSSTGVVYWGNGSNAVYDASARTCGFIPKDNDSTNATGTNQFGTDRFYRNNKENLFPFVGGYWAYAAYAGVFCRDFYYYRSYVSNVAGARASAYAS